VQDEKIEELKKEMTKEEALKLLETPRISNLQGLRATARVLIELQGDIRWLGKELKKLAEENSRLRRQLQERSAPQQGLKEDILIKTIKRVCEEENVDFKKLMKSFNR
jgi:hypothetical protein